MKMNQMFRIYGSDYKEMTMKILEASGLESLLKEKAFCIKSDTDGKQNLHIGIKPNLVTPSPAEFGATTHPEIVEGIIVYLQRAGYRDITVLEGSWAGDSTEEAFEFCGYRKLEETYGIRLYDTKQSAGRRQDCSGMELELCSILDEIDFLINVPVLKGHCQTKMTCCLKNMKGLIPDREKRRFHKMGLHDPIAHLNTGVRQDFIVIDGICGDPDFEEGGNPVLRNSILTARDPVMADAFACRELGWKPQDVAYVMKAEQLGVGRILEPEIIELNAPIAGNAPEVRRFLDVSYRVEDADTCSGCYSALTEALWRLREEGLLDLLPEGIGIGQGMRGKSGRFGIGNCTAGFENHIPGCPPEAEEIHRILRELIKQK